ncbi:Chromosome transmission fidelity protein [Trichinella pseudospiralis]
MCCLPNEHLQLWKRHMDIFELNCNYFENIIFLNISTTLNMAMQIVMAANQIGNIPELFIIELQGDLELSNSKSLSGTLISAFSCNRQGNAFMIIGRHILRGKVEQLQRPVALVKRCSDDVCTSSQQDVNFEISGIIYKKIRFNLRPKSIIFSHLK